MARQLTLVIALLASLLCTTTSAPIESCCFQSTAQTAVSDGCCAAMPCCAVQRAQESPPVAVTTGADRSIVAMAPVMCIAIGEIPSRRPSLNRRLELPIAHSPPRLALFCTFLI